MDSSISIPLLHDHHSHVSLYAALQGLPDLLNLDSPAAMALLASLPRDRLNLVKGWRTDRLSLGPDILVTLPPVLVVNASLHGYAMNQVALGFIEGLWPEFAERGFDPAWGELMLPELFVFYGRVAGLKSDKLEAFMEGLASIGIGSAEDMTVAGEEALELVAASPYSGRIRSWATPGVFRSLSAMGRARCAGIKIFLDGSLGAESAALDAPFLDGRHPGPLHSDAELESLLFELSEFRTELSIHALGHLAIEQALRILGRVEQSRGDFPGVRLEHVQFISRAQACKARDRGYRLSMQPNFSADSVDYVDRLLPRHCAKNNPFRMLIDEVGFKPGENLVFGSDGMPHGPENAMQWSRYPSQAGQRISEAEFLSGYGPSKGQPPAGAITMSYDESRRKVALLPGARATRN